MYAGCLLAAFMQQSADCDQCFMMHVCMQGNSTASANAVSMALSQGGPATAISQAVAQVVRSHLPAADLPVVADGFLGYKLSAVTFDADKICCYADWQQCSSTSGIVLVEQPHAWKSHTQSQHVVLLCLFHNTGLLGDMPALLLHLD